MCVLMCFISHALVTSGCRDNERTVRIQRVSTLEGGRGLVGPRLIPETEEVIQEKKYRKYLFGIHSDLNSSKLLCVDTNQSVRNVSPNNSSLVSPRMDMSSPRRSPWSENSSAWLVFGNNGYSFTANGTHRIVSRAELIYLKSGNKYRVSH